MAKQIKKTKKTKTIDRHAKNDTIPIKHFKLTRESKKVDGHILYRIKATVDSLHAKKGDLGGWVESIHNLYFNAWITDEACVYGNARIYGNALIYGDAHVFGDIIVYDIDYNTYGNAHVLDF